jgi:hypothetical protein
MMKQVHNHKADTHSSHASKQASIDFHGAALINHQGIEVPITEEMIQQACEQVQKSCMH